MHPILRKYSSLGIGEIRPHIEKVARPRVQVEPVVSGTRRQVFAFSKLQNSDMDTATVQ